MPEISVIVPVYNVENKIRRCIDSILAQTFTDFELILVDDGSTDHSGKICDGYAEEDNRVRVIHQENKGAAAARNKGINEADGRHIGFVDSDDYVDKDYLKILYGLATQKESSVSMCCYYSVDGERIVESKHRFCDGQVFDKEQIKSQLYNDIYFNTNTIGYYSLWNKLFSRNLIFDNGIHIDESMSFGEDMLFVMECLKYADRIVFSDKPLYYYEISPTGLFSRYYRGFVDDIMKCYTALLEQTKPISPENENPIPLSLKYWYYVNRQIQGIIKNETHINSEITRVLRHPNVGLLFKTIALLSDSEAKSYNIESNEMKVPRLVADNKYLKATIVSRYQQDSNYWLRKIRRILKQ